MHKTVIAQLLAGRRQKEQNKNNLNLIQEDINRIMRATGSHNPLFREANRGVIFTASFKPQDWKKKKKRQDLILPDTAYFNFGSLLLTPNIATAFMEALLIRINDMDLEEETNPQEMRSLLSGTRRDWDYGKEYEVKDAEPYCRGHPLVRRTFNFFTKIPQEFHVQTSMRAAVLNTIILLMFFHTINYTTPKITAALVAIVPDPTLERLDLLAWKGVVLKFMKGDQTQRMNDLKPFLYQYAGYMASKRAAIDNSLIGTGWIYLWLQQEVLNGNGQFVVAGIRGALELIARETETVLTPVIEFQIMCLLTTLDGIVSLVHLNDENQDIAEFLAERFAEFFDPIRVLALKTAQLLRQEHKAPGSALRNRCAASDPRFGLVQPTRPMPTSIHVVVNPKCPRSYNLNSLLMATPIEAEGEPYNDMEYIHYTRWRLVLQMLCCCGVEEVVAESEAHVPLILSQQSPEFVASIYERLLLIMAEAGQCQDASQAANLRAQKVKQVWDELCQTLQIKELIMPDVDRALIDDLPTNRLHPLRFTTIKAEPIWQPNTNVITSGSSAGLPRFSRTGAEDILMNIISRTVDVNAYLSPEFLASQRQKGVREVVKVMVGGGDGTLNYMLAGFVNLQYYGELLPLGVLDQLDLRFYILPAGEVNSLATYIAKNDLWYDANINRMLTSRLPAVPHIGNPGDYLEEPKSSKHNQQQRQQLSPDWNAVTTRTLLTKQIENYALEAKNVFSVNIYNCDAWFHDGQTDTYCTIPFFGRAEIGITAALVSPMGERQLGQHAGAPRPARQATDTIEGLAQKVALSLRVTYTPLGLDFEELPQKTKKGRYLSVMVINVPKPHEHSLGCEPWSEYMNFFMLESNHQVVTDQKLKSLADIAYWSRPEMSNWINVETVRSVADESLVNFDVLLDGEVFGPFHRVTFTPCAHPMNRKANLKLPIATFWPPEISRFR